MDLLVTTTDGLNQGVTNFVPMLINLVYAVVLVIVGWIIGGIFATAAKKLLELVKLEEFLKVHKVEDALGNVPVSKVLVQIVKYYIILLFLQAAISLLVPGTLTDFLTQVVDFIPKIIASAVILVFAAILGELAKEKVLEVYEKEAYMRLAGNGLKYVIIYMGLVMGLETIGLPTDILTMSFVTMLQAVGFAFALAVGLAFGFGGQEAAKDWVKEWRKRFHV